MSTRSLADNYGSDANGLVWGYWFAPGQPVRAIDASEIDAFFALPPGERAGQFLWLHFSLVHSSLEHWLRQHLRLPEGFLEVMRTEEGSTRVEQEDDALVAVIRDVLFETTFEASDVGSTAVSIQHDLMLSTRLRPLRSVDQLRAAVRSGRAFSSPVELLSHLLQDQAAVLGGILRKSTRRVDEIEDRLLANRLTTDRATLGSLRRSLVRLQRLLAPEPTALFRLLNRPPAWITPDDVQELRQAAEEFSTALGDSSALVERVKLIQEEHAALVNERTGRTLFLLTVVTVLALPINLVAGMFGMNVGGVPLATHPHGFALVVGGLLCLTLLLAYMAFGRERK